VKDPRGKGLSKEHKIGDIITVRDRLGRNMEGRIIMLDPLVVEFKGAYTEKDGRKWRVGILRE
jgi:hypothetical protein